MNNEAISVNQIYADLKHDQHKSEREHLRNNSSFDIMITKKKPLTPRSITIKNSINRFKHVEIPGLHKNTENITLNPIRLYEIWPGKNQFFCFGYFISGRYEDCKYVIITWSIILVFTVIYSIMIVPTLTTPCFTMPRTI